MSKSSDSEVVPNLPDLRLDDRLLFMFARSTDGFYLLYKIDVLGLLRENTREEELLPLIVFDRHVLPDLPFTFEFLEPNFYIIGQEKDHVFTLDKYKLLDLSPSETRRGSEFLKPISPMHDEKVNPLAFAYNDRLYVISKRCYPFLNRLGKIYYDFEVYSPSQKTWNRLGNKPMQDCVIKSHLILRHTVYFTTTYEVVLSYDLEDETWVTVFSPHGALDPFPENIYIPPPPTFDTQIQVVGNMVVGGFYRFGEGYFDICASLAIDPHDVCYGNHPLDKFANDVILNFFKVSGNSYKCDIPHREVKMDAPIPYCWHSSFNYAHEDEKRVNFFEAEFISSTFLPIDTKRQVIPGLLYSCMLV
ncbi:hypothetical protein POM88_052195 [Heracleum sosnowskyi]|uniref:Uncharacterized protein n=1 Tax=Heracleum sosnowskyi TaxID=360622 RepID=A0AAD8GTF1_9APIA|nr:hypothetical protein POM88_052195 [Heracleum sosnowskyi]